MLRNHIKHLKLYRAMQCYNVGSLPSVWNWVLNCCCVCYDPEIEVNVMSTDTTSGTTGFTLPPKTLWSAKGKCEARATGNELEARRTMGERKRRGRAFSPSLCPLRALVPQKKRDVWERGRVSQLFCKVIVYLLQALVRFTALTWLAEKWKKKQTLELQRKIATQQ